MPKTRPLHGSAGELLAVKEVAVTSDGAKVSEAVEQLEQEVALLSNLNHPNIVRYVGTRREPHALYIFLEYVPGGSIASLLVRFGPLDESIIKIYTRQLIEGIQAAQVLSLLVLGSPFCFITFLIVHRLHLSRLTRRAACHEISITYAARSASTQSC